jgi:DNA-binding FadR family transcriptional regulator
MVAEADVVGGVAQVLALIDRLVAEQDLAPGSRLPTERELSQRCGTNRGTVRRALDLLEADGRVIRHVGRGTFLSPAPATNRGQPARSVSPSEIMTARLLLEPQLMPLVVTSATEDDFAEMDRCLAGGDCAEGLAEFEPWDSALHRTLAAATHNNVLIAISDLLAGAREQPLWGGMKRRSFTAQRRDLYRADHHAIVNALRERDPDNAQQAMREHLKRVRDHILGEHH